jgi:hypothetical protein
MAWLRAIEESTGCLRLPNSVLLDPCLGYLMLLERILSKKAQENWDRPPRTNPPVWIDYLARAQFQQLQAAELSRNDNNNNNNNASGLIPNGELLFSLEPNHDDGYDGYDDESSNDNDDEDSAGDLPTLNVAGAFLDRRRLLIRILTCQSETFHAKANSLRQSHQWKDGAAQLTYSLTKIHQALNLADSEISKWILEGLEDVAYSKELAQDADIVEIAIFSLTTERDRFLSQAKQQEAYLVRKLQPQWESRDQVKQRIGTDKWNNNPTPKNDHAALRKEKEAQLRDIREALAFLASIDTMHVETASKLLKDKLLHNDSSSSSKKRYNGQRPIDYSRRVDWVHYPDPTECGWTFTGSWDVTEFFENNDGVKLDWYFTTGTVKTSLDHPTQGRTQLFAAKVDPETYVSILHNPRAHTGKRYQKRNQGDGGRPREKIETSMSTWA